ncbi:hypothetical protein IRJ41_001330 [Triplophysa rosa]|uniref:Uncharacterized protein n=1 Tax=Triplophysa rosa TaxID=992332 RepID=A0A9W7TT83_TRIRA|nr:hypothetical protein IRJ41_001330 [Triplophysa rosa]
MCCVPHFRLPSGVVSKRNNKPFLDIWHIDKSLGNTLEGVRASCFNHLYWTAASTPNGDGDVMEAKWKSMVNHVQDIHEHDTPMFPCCAHPHLEGEVRNKAWMEPACASALMDSLRVEYSKSPQALQERSAVLSSTTPSPLSRQE